MKKKEKYDLRQLDAKIEYKINGCGKIIPNVRIVSIFYKGSRIDKIETDDAVRFILDWLESE